MPQSIFISYVYEDKKHRDAVERWCTNELIGTNRVIISEFADLRQQGQRAIESHLKPRIRGAATVLCLIGENSHNSAWVKYELDVATSLNKKIVLARIPNTSGAAPEGYRNRTVHALDPSLLRILV
ncbi:MAG TPA: TIR domain-containing protein [Nannocystis exedens]|nr:TIR domain-containing protein [Nannocystis exedens]